ncbi:MAG: hypothetical protein BGN83_20280 [Rhizobium sp. 63-7]|nr:MAG: hypothetical protein BGN83_20280 [Rhizobium sp. 63-7]
MEGILVIADHLTLDSAVEELMQRHASSDETRVAFRCLSVFLRHGTAREMTTLLRLFESQFPVAAVQSA